MVYLCAILAVAAVGLGVWGWRLRERLRAEQTRRQRAERSRDEMVGFLNPFVHSILNSSDESHWLVGLATYLAEVVDADMVRVYARQGDELVFLTQHHELPPPREGDDDLRYLPQMRALSELRQERLALGEGQLGLSGKSGHSHLEQFIGNRADEIWCWLVVPMILAGETLGVIAAVNKRPKGAAFTDEDRVVLESLANLVAVGSTFIQVSGDLKAQERLRADLLVARDIQNSLLPSQAPQSPDFQLYGVNKPAATVSGDFYDFLEIDDNYLLVIVADATGKGIPACLLTGLCRTTVRAHAHHYKYDLQGLLHEVSRTLYRDTDALRFITMACCLVDKRDNTVEYASAGHTPLLMRDERGGVTPIKPEGAALGLLPSDCEPEFHTFAFSWAPGTSLMMFTDGLTEALNDAEEEFGQQRLMDTWRALDGDPEHSCRQVLQAVNEFTGDQPQDDDQTLVILTRTEPGEAGASAVVRRAPA